ncbi:hypothetical protein VNO77_05393 [Canavalia gladiata]|uniref:Uncharacterized protein n=1 Tax=Canavalia gladiata TaxID=3824 RepID=A0AAN9R9Z2_CANGL
MTGHVDIEGIRQCRPPLGFGFCRLHKLSVNSPFDMCTAASREQEPDNSISINFSNLYAPEHLIVNVKDQEKWKGFTENKAKVFSSVTIKWMQYPRTLHKASLAKIMNSVSSSIFRIVTSGSAVMCSFSFPSPKARVIAN